MLARCKIYAYCNSSSQSNDFLIKEPGWRQVSHVLSWIFFALAMATKVFHRPEYMSCIICCRLSDWQTHNTCANHLILLCGTCISTSFYLRVPISFHLAIHLPSVSFHKYISEARSIFATLPHLSIKCSQYCNFEVQTDEEEIPARGRWLER